jgi:(2R)-sulfolactate sulfo-lyase subunit alpha
MVQRSAPALNSINIESAKKQKTFIAPSSPTGGKMAIDFIVHDKADNVGVVVVEDVQAGKKLSGWIMETNETIALPALDAVPLGHKIALADLKKQTTILKYGHDVGRTVAEIGAGRHVHTHNLKTKRW